MGLLDLIFPKKCLECGSYGRYICSVCAARVRDGKWSGQVNFSIFRYEGVVKKAILALKYKFAYGVATELAELATSRLIRRGFKIRAYLVPIPLHGSRKNWRGFNQSYEVGKNISREMGWGLAPNLISKTISTKPQVGLTGSQREGNIAGTFTVNSDIDIAKANQLIVFDDVYTTGSTMKEAISTLKGVGFDKVFGITVAAN